MAVARAFDKKSSSEHNGHYFFWRPLRLIFAHAVCFGLALFLSFLVNGGMRVGDWWPKVFLAWLAATLIVKLVVFGVLHQYAGWWRYASVTDLLAIIKGSHISTLILVVGWYAGMNIHTVRAHMGVLVRVPQSVMLMDWAATIIILCGVRLAIRLYFEETRTVSSGRLRRLLIVGAGNAGEVLLREVHRMSEAQYEVVGFVDDDRRKIGARIHGVSILGTTEQIRELAVKHSIDEIVIAMPSAAHQDIRRVISQCQGANLKFSTVPNLLEIASGKVRVSQIREVDINDLLGRDPITLDTELIRAFIKDKVVLITGAGGSIGSEMCRQVGTYEPSKLLLIEQAENSLFFIERELHKRFPDLEIRGHICDITEKERLEVLFERYRPNVVIHAAAHKHVPLMEVDPGEAVKNNVRGTRNVAQAADKFGVKNFVMISTDKAVNPTSIMGSTKRIAEMSIQGLNRHSKTDFVTVRFGNVLGSNGSVIPIFKQQIAQGGPVTVTHPEMQRYFMTIPEASQLVLQAATMGKGGEVFVLDMGEPVKIVDLARDLITLSGFRPGEDIEIIYTGMRPGEKLFEELAITGENMQPTRHRKIGIWENVPTDEKTLDEVVAKLLAMANTASHEEIVATIKTIVPEYVGDVDCMKLRAEHLAKTNGHNHQPETSATDVTGEAAASAKGATSGLDGSDTSGSA